MSPRLRPRRASSALALLALTSIAGRVWAGPSAPAPPTIRLYVAAAEPVMAALVDRLRPRLRALRVELAATVVASVDVDAVLATPPATDERAPLAQVWLDGRTSSDAIVILVPRRADRVLARKIAGGAVFDEVALAEAVFVIERATASLLASRPVGVPKADAASELRASAPPPPVPAPGSVPSPLAPEPLAPERVVAPPNVPTPPEAAPATAPLVEPVPPAASSEPAPPVASPEPAPEARTVEVPVTTAAAPRAPSAVRIGIGLFAGAEAVSTASVFVPEVGMAALVERRGAGTRLGVILDVDLHRSVDLHTAYGTVELLGGGGHALLSLGRALRRGVARAAVGLGLAVSDARVMTEPTATPTAARPRTDLDPTLAMQLRWDLPLAALADIFVVAGADVVFVSGRYTAAVGGTTTTLLTTWPVRPTLRVGVAFGR